MPTQSLQSGAQVWPGPCESRPPGVADAIRVWPRPCKDRGATVALHTNGASVGPGKARQPSFGRAARLVGRALLLRCPNCGRGSVLKSWFQLRERCSACQVWLEREEGYFVG